jgi:threonine/homoserine/homoserine lactone efflux protein
VNASFFLKGMIVGFSVAAPVGPIGVLCIRRSLVDGRLVGFITGLGAATADAAYASIAAFGLTAISGFLVGQRFWLGLIGGLFLCYIGVRTFVSKPARQASQAETAGFCSAYFSTLLLTFGNPTTILSFVAIFAGFTIGISSDYFQAGALVLGVFAGSALWWLILSGSIGLLRSRMDSGWMRAVDRLSGTILFVFGLYILFAQVMTLK